MFQNPSDLFYPPHLLVCLASSSLVVTTAGSSLLSLHAAGLASLENGGGRELDVLLGRHAHHERGNVDHLLANSDVSLEDLNASLMGRVGQASLLDDGLQSAFQELRSVEGENVIEFALFLREETEADHASDQGLTLEKSSRVIYIHSEQNTSCLSNRHTTHRHGYKRAQ